MKNSKKIQYLTYLAAMGLTEGELLKATQKATDRYLTLFNNMDQGFCIIEMIFDEKGGASDYRFLEVNPVFEKQTGLAKE